MSSFSMSKVLCSAIFFVAVWSCGAEVPSSNIPESQQSAIWNGFAEELKTILEDQDYDERHYRLDQLPRKLREIDPQRAWLLGSQIESQDDQIVFLIRLMKKWGKVAPLEALKHAQTPPDGETRMMAVNAALEGWALEAPLEALKWASDNLSNAYRRTAYSQIGQVWAKKAPAAALNWGTQLSNELERIFYTAEVLETWTEINPLNAAHWTDTLPPGKFRDLMISKVLKKWAQHYPKWAVEWLEKTPENYWLLPNSLTQWAQVDRSAALNWTLAFKDRQVASLCVEALMVDWAEYNPKAAYSWSNSHLKGESLINGRKSILGIWTSSYPLEALNWAESLTAADNSITAIEIILENWSTYDLDSCRAYVMAHKNALIKNIGIRKMIDVLVDSEPNSAAELALSLSDLELKKSSLLRVLEKWKAVSAKDSAAWLKHHPEISELLTQ